MLQTPPGTASGSSIRSHEEKEWRRQKVERNLGLLKRLGLFRGERGFFIRKNKNVIR